MNKRVAVVSVLDLSNQHVLLIRRAPEYPFEHRHDWSFVSETFEPDHDDDLYHCASRGLREEVGMHYSPSEFYSIHSLYDEGTCLQFFTLPIPSKRVVDLSYEIDEVADHRWCPIDSCLSWMDGSPHMHDNLTIVDRLRAFLWQCPQYLF